ncbi:MAG: starch-binding protein [Ruminococcus sp.]|nr:starch-binding protein [Ruminococcus sp.]
MSKKITSIILAIIILSLSALSLSSCGEKKTPDKSGGSGSAENKLTTDIKDGTILHCFCWDFDTISNSLEEIAAAGFSAIQTSPVNECLEGENGGMQLYGDGKWYYHFQPTDYKIGNYQLGTRDQFKAMCEKADKLGIKVIVDVVPNHTTPTTDAINKNLLDAVGGLDKLYHKNNDKDISNWGDRLQCTTYKMGGLPDINTENKDFQDYFIAYLNDCIECGADGFRYDAAKHIGLPDDPTETKGVKNNFWTRVTKEIKDAKRIFNYGEVLQGDNDRIGDYINKIGACTASTLGGSVRSAVTSCNLNSAFFKDLRVGTNESCVTWVESHDNYINDGNWYQMDDRQVILGYAILAARAKGTPLFFDRPYGNSTEEQWGTMNRIGTSGDMFYKDSSVVEVNFFRNAMVGEKENFYNPADDSSAVEICRGKKGAVIINTADKLKLNMKTDLADGTYIDRVDNKTEYTVKNGIITCDTEIPEDTVVVLYNDGYVDHAKSAEVKISDNTSCIFSGDSVDVKLESKDAKKAIYAIGDGKETEYKDGDKITIKTSDGEGGVINLILRGENEKGTKSYMKYVFTNPDKMYEGKGVKKGDSVTFVKPDSWGKNIYAYIYFGDNSEAAWPGYEMTNTGGNNYTYSVKEDWNAAYIIFSDGTNQYPGQGEQGFELEANKQYSIP